MSKTELQKVLFDFHYFLDDEQFEILLERYGNCILATPCCSNLIEHYYSEVWFRSFDDMLFVLAIIFTAIFFLTIFSLTGRNQ